MTSAVEKTRQARYVFKHLRRCFTMFERERERERARAQGVVATYGAQLTRKAVLTVSSRSRCSEMPSRASSGDTPRRHGHPASLGPVMATVNGSAAASCSRRHARRAQEEPRARRRNNACLATSSLSLLNAKISACVCALRLSQSEHGAHFESKTEESKTLREKQIKSGEMEEGQRSTANQIQHVFFRSLAVVHSHQPH